MRFGDEKIIFVSARRFCRDTHWKPLKTLKHTLAAMLCYWERLM
jgi:hypothetical protein